MQVIEVTFRIQTNHTPGEIGEMVLKYLNVSELSARVAEIGPGAEPESNLGNCRTCQVTRMVNKAGYCERCIPVIKGGRK